VVPTHPLNNIGINSPQKARAVTKLMDCKRPTLVKTFGFIGNSWASCYSQPIRTNIETEKTCPVLACVEFLIITIKQHCLRNLEIWRR